MNRFIIKDGLPYLYADNKAYKCRFDEKGFTLGAEVELTEAPEAVYGEKSIMAKLQCLDSIGKEEEPKKKTTKKKAEK